ncbi:MULTISPECIES: PHP domain-containing protein [unclassified Pseudodesulfovibrio]|uniref:PHP domain-containing protein n=1 Tax=unclassified Pseudodesulfovibrio TaxID=2661612 RepID=UPI001F4FDE4E|nr:MULTISPECIES: PHP domain-containing protein [unclassified Pseudodesulfovibrio]MCJ2162969.1 PHP domain-containing protein [Pseudodesulfovibrio sp. S3-i]
MLIDLHVHSTCSPCSVLTPAEILAHARGRGLDGVCITDHDTMDILSHIKAGFQSDGLFVAVGMEYATPQGDYLVFGDIASLPGGLPASDLLSRVSALGGAAIAAHPCRVRRPADPALFGTGLFSLVEVNNGRNSMEENEQAHSLVSRFDMIAVAGSDAHRLDELGRCPTRFTVPITSTADLVDALNQGCCLPFSMHRKVA